MNQWYISRTTTLVKLGLVLALMLQPGVQGEPDSGHDAALMDRPLRFGDQPDTAFGPAEQSGLFGRFESTSTGAAGSFMSMEVQANEGLLTQIHHNDQPLLERIETGMSDAVQILDGPVLVLHNDEAAITLHDNARGWISIRGLRHSVGLTFAAGTELHEEEGLILADTPAGSVQIHDERRTGWVANILENHVELAPKDDALYATITLTPGIFQGTGTPGAWALAAATEHGMIVDILRPWPTPPTITDEHTFVFDLPSVPPRAANMLLLLESAGLHPDEDTQISVQAERPYCFQRVPANAVVPFASVRLAPVFNATTQDSVLQTLVRVPEGYQGRLAILYDPDPPRPISVLPDNLSEPWNPEERIPNLVTETDECATGRLIIPRPDQADYERPTVQPHYLQRFRLTGLQPDTAYEYTLRFTDLVGNTNETQGTFRTPIAAKSHSEATVSILTPQRESVLPTGRAVDVRVAATTADGPVDPQRLRLFVDKASTNTRFELRDGHHHALLDDLTEGEHELRVELPLGGGLLHDTVRFRIGTDNQSPALPILLLLVLVHAAVGFARIRQRQAAAGADRVGGRP